MTLVYGSNQSTITALFPASTYFTPQVSGLSLSQVDRPTNYRPSPIATYP